MTGTTVVNPRFLQLLRQLDEKEPFSGKNLCVEVTVLAEFVETAEQRDTLHEIGCDCYQGYLYSPAVFLEKKEPQAA